MKLDLNDVVNKLTWGFFAGFGFMLAQWVAGFVGPIIQRAGG